MTLPRHALIPLIIACALFMENLDSTVLATSLPAIAVDLREDPIALKLALTSYLLSLAVFVPVSGWLADRYGPRTVFTAAIAIFTLGSVACGLCSSLAEFVAARIVQGLGGALMVPVGRLVILRAVPKHELISALAWLTVPALIGPVAGPPLGGFLTTYLHWRWIFYINVPIGMIGLALAWRFIDNARPDTPPPLDARGLMISGTGLSALIFGLALLGQDRVPLGLAAAITALGLGLCGLYARHARRAAHPVIDLALLAIPTFRAGVIGASLFRVGFGATPFLLPLMLQLGFGLSAFRSGLLTFAVAVGALIMKATAAPILHRFGFRPVLTGNALICAALFALPALFTPATPHALIVTVLLVGGFFRSLEFTAMQAITYADISPQAMSRATSFASVAQQVSLSLGVAAGALILESARALRVEPRLDLVDFSLAFVIVATIGGTAALVFARLPGDAGAALARRPAQSASERSAKPPRACFRPRPGADPAAPPPRPGL